MASFNLTAQLNISGPANLKPVISNIRKQLSSINPNINININTANLASSSKSLQDLNTNLKSITVSATSAADAMRKFGAAVGSVNMSSLPKNMSAATQQSQQLQQQQARTAQTIKESGNSMVEFGKQSALAIRRFAAFTLVTGMIYKFTGALSSASDEFMKFNKQMVQLSQVTGTSLPGLAGLEREITSLSTSLGVSSSSLIDISSTLAQAGLSAQETEQALRALAKSTLAPSFDDLNSTVEGSIALMRQFSISTAELDGALGSINAVAAKFAVEAGDIITAIQRTGGVFAASSKGVAEGTEALNQFIAVFTSIRATTRESAETIATGLRTIFTRIQRRETIDTLKQFGVQLTDLEGKFVGPYEAVKRLSQGLSGLDTRDIRFSSIIEELGGFRQVGKVIPLLQQFATAEKALGVAQRGQGSLTADAAKAQQALAVQMTKVQEEFISLVRKIGSSNEFQTMVKLALNLASAFISVADSAKHALPAITALLAVKGTIGAFRFASGFMGGMRGGGGGRGAGDRMSGAPKGFANGGKIQRFSEGGVPVALEAGEMVFSGPETVKKYGGPTALGRYNRTGQRPPNLNLARGGGVFMVPGSGRGDNFKTTLPTGSFVIKRQSVRAAAANGGTIGYARGGAVDLASFKPYVSYSDTTFDKAAGEDIRQRVTTASGKDKKRLRFNKKDQLEANIRREPIALNLEDSRIPDYLKDQYTKGSPRDRGYAFEDILSKLGYYKKETGSNFSRIDGSRSNNEPVEIRSRNEQTSTRVLLNKLAGAIIGRTTETDRIVASTASQSILNNQPNIIKGGNLTVLEDATKLKSIKTQEEIEANENKKSKSKKPRRKRAALGGLIQRFSEGTDKPLKDMKRAGLLEEANKLGVNAQSLVSWADLGNKGDIGNQARAKLIAKLEEQRVLRKTAQTQTSQRAKKTNIAVIGAMADTGVRGSSREVMIPGAKDRKTGKKTRDTPATLHIGALEGKTAARVSAIIRNQTARITQKVMKVIAQEAGMGLPKGIAGRLKKKPIHSGIAGGLLERAILELMGIDAPLGSVDLGAKGLSPELAKVFGIPSAAGVPTDITYGGEGGKTLEEAATRKAVGRSRNSKGQKTSSQIGRALAAIKGAQGKALGGQVQRLSRGSSGGLTNKIAVSDHDMTGAVTKGKETPSLSNFIRPEIAVPDILSGKPTKLIHLLKQYGATQILTARAGGPRGEMKKALGAFYEKNGLLIPQSRITTLGDQINDIPTPERKARALYELVKRYGKGNVHFFDDSEENINAAKDVKGVTARRIKVRKALGGQVQRLAIGGRASRSPSKLVPSEKGVGLLATNKPKKLGISSYDEVLEKAKVHPKERDHIATSLAAGDYDPNSEETRKYIQERINQRNAKLSQRTNVSALTESLKTQPAITTENQRRIADEQRSLPDPQYAPPRSPFERPMGLLPGMRRLSIGGNVERQRLANAGVAKKKKQTSINKTNAQALLEKNAGKSPVIRRILSKPTAVRDFAQTLKKQGVTIPPFPKFVGSGMANAVFDIGNKKMLKVSLTDFGDNMMAGNFFGEDVAKKMGMTGNYQLPIGIPGVAGYSSRVDTGILSSAIQDKAAMKIKGRNKTKDADELIKRLRKQKGLTGIDLHDDNIGYRYNPKTKKQEPVIIDGLVVPDDKLPPGFKFSDHLKNGGEVQRLAQGTSSGPLRYRKRITGLLDVDKLRDSERAREAMQKTGFYNPKKDTYDVSGYRDSLANAALAERQKKNGAVDYMAADLGSPGAGKSTFGLKGKGSKRYIETIEDLQEMIASGNRVSIRNAMASLDEDKIRHLSQYDRIRVLSSTTPEEMKELKGRLKNRTRQGKESIAATGVDTTTQFNRRHTIKAQSSEDTEAMLRFKDENGKQIIDESKIATYSISTGKRKKAHEVPMVRHEALNVIKGGFGPTTREGHVEGLFKKAKKDKKLLINVGPDESLTLQEILSGSGKAHGARTVIFDRKTRKKMVEKSVKDENLNAYVSTSGDGFGLSDMFKVGKDPKTGQSIYTQPDKKKSTIVIGEDRAGSEQKYRDMGYDNVQIVPRGEGAASASKVRDDMFEKRDFSGVTPSVRKMLEEASQRGVFENTLNTLPKVVQHVQKKAQAKIASIDLDLDKLLTSVPGGRLTEAFTKQNPELAKEIKRLRAKKSDIKGSAKRSDIHTAMRNLKKRYPEKYGFNMGDEEESSFKPMRPFTGKGSERLQTAAIGGLIQRFAKGSSSPLSRSKTREGILLSSLKQNKTTGEVFRDNNSTIRQILRIGDLDSSLSEIQKAYGIKDAKFLGSGGENVAFDIGGDRVLKISRTGKGIQQLARENGVGKKGVEKMGNYQLPMGVKGVSGYRDTKTFGPLTASIQDKVVTRDDDKATRDAELLQGRLAKRGKIWIDVDPSNMGYDKKGKPTVIDGMVLRKSYVEKMRPDYSEDHLTDAAIAESKLDMWLKKRQQKRAKKSAGGAKRLAGGTSKPLSSNVPGEIPIMAQAGEFVLNKHATGQIGEHTLAKLNRGGKVASNALNKLPKYHTGGVVQKFAGGTSKPLSPIATSTSKSVPVVKSKEPPRLFPGEVAKIEKGLLAKIASIKDPTLQKNLRLEVETVFGGDEGARSTFQMLTSVKEGQKEKVLSEIIRITKKVKNLTNPAVVTNVVSSQSPTKPTNPAPIVKTVSTQTPTKPTTSAPIAKTVSATTPTKPQASTQTKLAAPAPKAPQTAPTNDPRIVANSFWDGTTGQGRRSLLGVPPNADMPGIHRKSFDQLSPAEQNAVISKVTGNPVQPQQGMSPSAAPSVQAPIKPAAPPPPPPTPQQKTSARLNSLAIGPKPAAPPPPPGPVLPKSSNFLDRLTQEQRVDAKAALAAGRGYAINTKDIGIKKKPSDLTGIDPKTGLPYGAKHKVAPPPPPTSQQKQEAYRKQLTARAIQSGVKIPALPLPPKKYAIGGIVQKFNKGSSAPLASKAVKPTNHIGISSTPHMITAIYLGAGKKGAVQAKEIGDGVWTVGMSGVSVKGSGPGLYDAVMREVTKRGGVLTADRNVRSAAAQGIWKGYSEKRNEDSEKYGPKVDRKPLDPKYHTSIRQSGNKDTPASDDPMEYGYSLSSPTPDHTKIHTLGKEHDKTVQHEVMGALYLQRKAYGGNIRPLSRKPSLAPKPQIQNNNELNTIQSQINDLELRRKTLDSHTKIGLFGGKSNQYQKELHEAEDEIARLSQRKHRLSKSAQPTTTTRSSILPVPARLLPPPVATRQAPTPKQTTVVPQSRPAPVPARSSTPPRLPTQVAPKAKPQIKNNELQVIQSQINDLKHREATLNSHTKTSFFGGKSNPYQVELHKLQDEIDRLSQRKYRLEQSSAPNRFAAGGEIPIMAKEGEFVLNKHAAGQIGPHTLKKLNRGGKVAAGALAKLPKYHSGGSVQRLSVGGITGKSFTDLASPDDALIRGGDKIAYIKAPGEELDENRRKTEARLARSKNREKQKRKRLKKEYKVATSIGDTSVADQIKEEAKQSRQREKNFRVQVRQKFNTNLPSNEQQAKERQDTAIASTVSASKKTGGKTATQMRADLEAKNAALPPDQRKNLHKSLDTVTAEASAPKPVVPKPGDPGFVGPLLPGVAEARAKQQAAGLEKQKAAAKAAGFSTKVGTSGTKVATDSDVEKFKKSRRKQKEKARTPTSEAVSLGASQNPIIKQQNRDAAKQANAQQSRGPGAIPGFFGGAVGGAMSGASKGATVARGQNGGRVSTVVGGAIGGTVGLVGGAVKGALGSEKSNRIRSMQYGVAADKLRARAGDMAKGGSSSSGTLAVLNKAFAPLVSTASKLNSGMSSLHTGAAKAAQSLSSAGGGLIAYGNNVKNASGIMGKLYAATSPAINGLKKLGSSVIKGADSAIGRLGGMQKVNENGKQVWRNAPGGIMGRVGGFLGMGGGGGTMGDDGVTRGPDGKRKKGFGGGGRKGGGGGGMGGMGMYAAEMGLSMAGSAAVEQLAAATGGQKTKEGREISTIGGSAVSGASMGMMMGSMAGPLGMAAGAAIGGIGGALYGQSQMPEIERQAASQKRMESIEKAGGKMSQNLSIASNTQAPEKTRKEAEARAQADFETISSNSRAESVAGAKKKDRTWAEYSVGVGPSAAKTVEERVESAQPAADKAKEMLSYKMQKTGKNLQELEASMPKAEFDKLTEAIALTDKGYQSLLESVYADGEVTDAEAATLERARKAAMEREGADVKASGEAAKTAKQNAQMTQAMQKVTTSFEKMATAITAAAGRADKVMENGKLGIEAVDNPMAAVQQGQISQSADILSNPEAYSMNDVEGALRQNSSMAGSSSEAMVQSAMLPRKLEQNFGTAMQEAKAGGKDDAGTRDAVKKAMMGTVTQAFGPDIASGMSERINTFLNEFEGDITQVDFNDLVKKFPELANTVAASEKTFAALQKQSETAAKAIGMIGDAAQKSAGKGQEIRNRDADTYSTVANSTLAFKRATGEKISYQADAGVRNQARATRLGTSAQVASSPKAMLDRYNQLNKATGTAATAQQQITEANRPALLSGDENQSSGAIKAMENAARTTAEFAQATQQARDEIMNLPNDIKENIGGIMQELQDVMQERAAKIGAAGGLMEKMLTSTPKDLRKMGNTFNNLNQTLSGKGVSFEQSQSANMAYNQARKQGGSHMQAQRSAQEAYAQESGDTISMAKELAPLLGAVDPEAQNKMMGSVYESMFAARGQDTSKMMVGDKSMKEYIQMMKEGGKKDPKVQALEGALAAQQGALQAANDAAKQLIAQEAEALTTKTGAAVLDAMIQGAEAVRVAVAEGKQIGITPPGEVGKPGAGGKQMSDAQRDVAIKEEEQKLATATKEGDVEQQMSSKHKMAVLGGSSKEDIAQNVYGKKYEDMAKEEKESFDLDHSAVVGNYENQYGYIGPGGNKPPPAPTPVTPPPTPNATGAQGAANGQQAAAPAPATGTAQQVAAPVPVAATGQPAAPARTTPQATGAVTPAPTVYGATQPQAAFFPPANAVDASQQSKANLDAERKAAEQNNAASTNAVTANNTSSQTAPSQPQRQGPMSYSDIRDQKKKQYEQSRYQKQQQYLSGFNEETREKMKTKLGSRLLEDPNSTTAPAQNNQLPGTAPASTRSGSSTPQASAPMGSPVAAPRDPQAQASQNQGAGVLSNNGFEAFANKLDNLLTQLASVNIPTEIRLTSEQLGVNITLNGAEVMNNLGPALASNVMKQAGEQLARYDQATTGEGAARSPGVMGGQSV